MADESPRIKVDVPFAKGVIPAAVLGVSTNFLAQYDDAGREYSRIYGRLNDVIDYLLKHWHNDPVVVLGALVGATTYGQ